MKGSKIKKMMAHDAAEFITAEEVTKMLNSWAIVRFVESHMDKKRTKFIHDMSEFDPNGVMISYPRRFFARMLQDIAESKTRSIIAEAQHLDPLIYKDQESKDRLYKGRYEHYREKYRDRRAHEVATTNYIDSLRKATIERSIGFTWGYKLSIGQKIDTIYGPAKVVAVSVPADQNGMNGMCDLLFRDGCKVHIEWGGNIPRFYDTKEERKWRARMWLKGVPKFDIGDMVYVSYPFESHGKVVGVIGNMYAVSLPSPTHRIGQVLVDREMIHSIDYGIEERPIRFITYCKDIVYQDGEFILAIPKLDNTTIIGGNKILFFFTSRNDFKNWARAIPITMDDFTVYSAFVGMEELNGLEFYDDEKYNPKLEEMLEHQMQVGAAPGTVKDLANFLWDKPEPEEPVVLEEEDD